MTTPNSLNKHMMSSWSIAPDRRRNAQNYNTNTHRDLIFQFISATLSSRWLRSTSLWGVTLCTLTVALLSVMSVVYYKQVSCLHVFLSLFLV